jgi:hypothetical protein
MGLQFENRCYYFHPTYETFKIRPEIFLQKAYKMMQNHEKGVHSCFKVRNQ